MRARIAISVIAVPLIVSGCTTSATAPSPSASVPPTSSPASVAGHMVYETAGPGRSQVGEMNVDGTGAHLLPVNNMVCCYAPALSPDGSALLFAGEGTVSISRPDGRASRTIWSSGLASVTATSWSPHGDRIAFSANDPTPAGPPMTAIFTAETNGHNLRKIAVGINIHDLAWSPDASRIAFLQNQSDIWVVPSTGGTVRSIFGAAQGQGSNELPGSLSWAPSTTILFDEVGQSPNGIWQVNGDGSNPRSLLPDGTSPSWSPDGSRFAAIRNGRIVIASSSGRVEATTGPTRIRTVQWGGSGQATLFTWAIANRWGTVSIPGTGHDTAHPYSIPTYPSLNPGVFPVDFDACAASSGTVSWSWAFPDGTTDVRTSCRETHALAQGAQSVTLTMTDAAGARRRAVQDVKVTDLLIASLGDSVAAGEGNPDSAGDCDHPGNRDVFTGDNQNLRQQFSFCPKIRNGPSYDGSVAGKYTAIQLNPKRPTWWPQQPSPASATADSTDNQSQQCHRSTHAGPARAAYELQSDHAYNPNGAFGVTFVQLACSGARTDTGLLGSYGGLGQKPTGQQYPTQLPAQLSALQSLTAGRSVDAVVLTIGGNDINFSDILTGCLQNGVDCALPADVEKSAAQGTPQNVTKNLTALSDHLDNIAVCLSGGTTACTDSDITSPTGLGIPASHVYLTTYFNPAQDDNGNNCNYDVIFSRSTLSPDEFRWANTNLVGPLNDALKAAAKKNGWNLIDVNSDFTKHGVCATDHWITRFDETFQHQGDQYGFFHPNGAGQDDYAKRILQALTANPLPHK